MKHVGTPKGHLQTAFAFAVLAQLPLVGCSTTELKPVPVPTVAPPKYVQVPQPAGFDVADVAGLFHAQGAPKPESLKECDADFRKLRNATPSDDEVRQGARELVRQDPVAYHWCFYGKILEVEAAVKSMLYVDDRQKKVLEAYAFLAPVARGFMKEYQDSRYLRWAIRHYRGLSAWVFQRKLEQNEQTTRELVEVSNPFGLWREQNPNRSILEKYNIAKPQPDPAQSSPAPIFPPAEAIETAEAGDQAATGDRFPASTPDATESPGPAPQQPAAPIPVPSVMPVTAP